MENEECRYFFQQHKMKSSTASYYAITLRKLFRFIGEPPGHVSFRHFYRNFNKKGELLSTSRIDYQFISDFLKTIPETQTVTRNNTISYLRTFFKILCGSGGPLEGLPNPLEGIKITATRPAIRDIVTPHELEIILASAAATGYQQLARAIVTTLYGTGIRVSELINLPVENSPANLQALLVSPIKTKKEYLLPLLPRVVNSIVEYIRGERARVPATPATASFLFLTPKGKKLSGQWVNKLLRTLCTAAGIKKNITAHCMRHSFATNLWQNGAGLVEIKELLNHASIAATRNYVHLLPSSNLREMVDQGPLAEIVGNFWRNKSL